MPFVCRYTPTSRAGGGRTHTASRPTDFKTRHRCLLRRCLVYAGQKYTITAYMGVKGQLMPSQTTLVQRTFFPTVAIAAEAFLTDCHIRRLSPQTIEYYQCKLTGFIAFAEAQQAKNLDQVDAALLRRFFLWLEETGHNAGGRHAFFRALRAFFRWLENEYEGYTSPLRKLKPPKVDNPPIEGASMDEVQAMLDVCGKSFTGCRDKAILLVLLDAGIRAGELLALDWTDIDLVTGRVLIRKGKGGKFRVVFLGRLARQAMRKYAGQRNDDHPAVFVSAATGERLTYGSLRAILTRRAKQAGLKQVPSPHDFRRAAALQMLRNGADVVSVSRLLGHSSLEVTKRYLAQTETDLQQAHQRASPADVSLAKKPFLKALKKRS
jgi:integrase/recombinase XerD